MSSFDDIIAIVEFHRQRWKPPPSLTISLTRSLLSFLREGKVATVKFRKNESSVFTAPSMFHTTIFTSKEFADRWFDSECFAMDIYFAARKFRAKYRQSFRRHFWVFSLLSFMTSFFPGRTVQLSTLLINAMTLCFCAMYFTCVGLFALRRSRFAIDVFTGK